MHTTSNNITLLGEHIVNLCNRELPDKLPTNHKYISNVGGVLCPILNLIYKEYNFLSKKEKLFVLAKLFADRFVRSRDLSNNLGSIIKRHELHKEFNRLNSIFNSMISSFSNVLGVESDNDEILSYACILPEIKSTMSLTEIKKLIKKC